MKERWIVQAKKADFNQIAKKYHISPVLARIIRNRDVVNDDDIRKYLFGTVEDLYEAELLKDIKKAADYIEKAVYSKNKISIASDFDDDGIFASMILYTAFTRIGGMARVDTPYRITEGYGLNNRIVENAAADGISLIVTCDNGIAAFEAVSRAKELGLQVVVTDHHEVPYEEDALGNRVHKLPMADAIVNPKQQDCTYPYKCLCGAGVAFKLAEILYRRFSIPKEELYGLLEFTAIATIADVMDLTDENRIIVKEGLRRLRKTKNYGLQAIMKVNNIVPENLNAYHIGFVIGPCFNAAGRLDTVKIALDLLTAKTMKEAERLASELKALNDNRKDMTAEGVEKALALIEQSDIKDDKVIVVKLDGCHESLVGIIAGRIREKYHKPTFVFTDAEEGIKGSGRSIEAFDMYESLVPCKDLLSRFGGHKMAAGLSLPAQNFDALRKRLNENAMLTEEDFTPIIPIDVPMPIQFADEAFIESLELLEPFGKANPKPLFAEQHFKILKASVLGKNRNVLKMQVMNRDGIVMDAIYFGAIQDLLDFIQEEFGQHQLEAVQKGRQNNIDLAFTYYPSVNEYMGTRTLQIVVQNYCRIK